MDFQSMEVFAGGHSRRGEYHAPPYGSSGDRPSLAGKSYSQAPNDTESPVGEMLGASAQRSICKRSREYPHAKPGFKMISETKRQGKRGHKGETRVS